MGVITIHNCVINFLFVFKAINNIFWPCLRQLSADPPPPQKKPISFFKHTFQTILRRKKMLENFSKNNFVEKKKIKNFLFQNSKIFFEHTLQTILRRKFISLMLHFYFAIFGRVNC